MERHRAQLADAAIEEQLEVQTAFREQVGRQGGTEGLGFEGFCTEQFIPEPNSILCYALRQSQVFPAWLSRLL